jgi:hypothetical protein
LTNTSQDDLIRLVQESEAADERMASLRGRKAEHESALKNLEETHRRRMREVQELAEHLNRATDDLRRMADERTGRSCELRDLAMEIKETAKRGRALRKAIREGVGRDVCPKCGSTEIATIVYGYPLEEPDDDDLFEVPHVMGGCCVDDEETVSCMDCGTHFLGNLDRWRYAQIDSSKPETVFEVGAEGGTLAIVRERTRHGIWEYQSRLNESTIIELLPESELGNRDDLIQESAFMDTFEDALIRLGKYPWFSFTPLKVHPEFADIVLREVRKRGGRKAAAEWNKRLESHLG